MRVHEALIRCERAGRTYGRGDRAVVALHGVSCTVTPDSRVALMGPSGSGKTTLLHLMAGLDQATSGRVEWPCWGGSPFGNPTRAGVAFQEASLIPSLSALENVAFPLLVAGTDPEAAVARAHEVMGLLDISGVAGQTPDELSGGQAQRVAVARVITVEPAVILADEPTGKLDSASGRHVIDLLLRASDHVKAGLVVSTHDPDLAQRLSQVWSLTDGELHADATGSNSPEAELAVRP